MLNGGLDQDSRDFSRATICSTRPRAILFFSCRAANSWRSICWSFLRSSFSRLILSHNSIMSEIRCSSFSIVSSTLQVQINPVILSSYRRIMILNEGNIICSAVCVKWQSVKLGLFCRKTPTKKHYFAAFPCQGPETSPGTWFNIRSSLSFN